MSGGKSHHSHKFTVMKNAENGPILFFDGVCTLCNASVDFIIRHDKKSAFRFASLQSEFAQNELKKAGFYNETNVFSENSMNTVVLLADGNVFKKSDAALEIARRLGGFWSVFYFFKILPRPVRDFFYDLVARNRYRFFGKKETCRLPTSAERARFLG